MQGHLKKVYGTLSVSMLAAAAGAYVHVVMRLFTVSSYDETLPDSQSQTELQCSSN